MIQRKLYPRDRVSSRGHYATVCPGKRCGLILIKVITNDIDWSIFLVISILPDIL
jgi:hypothetical protein